ncbi:MAG: hypothetical protein BroJett025_11240 [Patescibacteria group bacterium]|nr:MAG: hypothetical protein BroJett025_11240 [Patescibacteria group bacterium]
MKITSKTLREKLVKLCNELNQETGEYQDWYFPEESKSIREHLPPGGWLKQKAKLMKGLEAVANAMTSKYGKGHELGLAAISNSNMVRRLAHILDQFTGEDMEIGGLDELYWKEADIAIEVIEMDFARIKKKVFASTEGELYRLEKADADAKAKAEKEKQEAKKSKGKKKKEKKNESSPPEAPAPEAENAESEPAQEQTAAPAGKKFGLPNVNFSMKKVVGVVAVLVALYLILGTGLLGTITGMISGDGASQPLVYNQVDPNATSPGYTVNPDGTITLNPTDNSSNPAVQITPSAQNLQTKVQNLLALLKEGRLVAMILLSLGGLVLIMFDRAADFEVEDFYVSLAILAAYLVMVLLTDGTVTLAGKQIEMDLLLTILMAGALFVVAWLGNRDFTVVSVGMFLAGNILFVTNITAFAAFQPPPVALQAWAIGGAVQLMEMIRQENTGKTILIGAVGIVVQAVLFFVILGKLSTATDPFVVSHVQVISYTSAIILTFIGIVGFMFAGLKTDVFKNINGIQNTINTAMFDVAVVANCFGALWLMLYIW